MGLDLEYTLTLKVEFMKSRATIQTITIQEAAQQTGVSTHTLRYYERMNLLDSIRRDTNGHRQYTADDLASIEFLTRLRATKMPIRQMQQFAKLRRQGISTAEQRRLLLEQHYNAVVVNQQELNQSLDVISKKITFYKEVNAQGITDEQVARQIPAYAAMVQAGIRHRTINLPLEPEAAAQTLLLHFDPEQISELIAVLQPKIHAGVR